MPRVSAAARKAASSPAARKKAAETRRRNAALKQTSLKALLDSLPKSKTKPGRKPLVDRVELAARLIVYVVQHWQP